MELFLIRHGQSINNSLPEQDRIEDPPLTAVGRKQAALLAESLRCVGLTRLITSPFRRTLQTTEFVRQTTGLRPEVWIDLHEQGGCFSGWRPGRMVGRPGMTRFQIEKEFPGCRIAEEIDGDGWWGSKPYELVEQARSRAERLIRRTFEEFGQTDERVAFVMHGTFKLLFIKCFHSDSAGEADRLLAVHNSAVTKIVVKSEMMRLEYFNDVAHVPADLLTL